MKLLHHPERENLRESAKVSLADGVSLTVYSLPITFEIDFNAEMPRPAEDEGQEAEEYNLLHAAGMIHACVDPAEVAFDTIREEGQESVDYYRRLLRELSHFFTIRQIQAIGEKITEMSMPTEREVRVAEKDFFEEDQTREG